MDQGSLFHEDIYDALRSAIKALGGTKTVGAKLWPEKTIADARSYLDDCLNKDRPAKLSPEHVLLLLKWARDAGFHEAMHYIAGEAGYLAQPVEPRDELTEMLSEYLRLRKRGGTLEEKIEDARTKLKLA